MKKNILALAVLSLMFSSCSVKLGEVEAGSAAPPTLDGTWATSCMGDGPHSYVETYHLENGNLQKAILRYDNNTICDQAALSTTVIVSGKFTLIGDGFAEDVKNYEWEIEMVAGIPNVQALVDDLNANSVCGSNLWAVGQPQILLGCNMGGSLDLTNVAYGTKHYGIYEIQENVSPLYVQFGADCAEAGYGDFCSTAGARPTDFDGTVFFKQ
jgi:hypothetical protein